MATQNQGNANVVVRSFSYDNASYLTRNSFQCAINSAGSGATTGKFYVHTAMILYGVRFNTVAAGTSTYTVNGTATTQANQWNVIYITNTNTTGTAVTLGTTTVGPFTVGGTSSTGTNVNVGGFGGGVAGGFQGPYAVNTLGGTNTSQTWGTLTLTVGTASGSNVYSNGPYGAGSIGQGGLPMNPGDVIYCVGGTDATNTVIASFEWTLQPPGYGNPGALCVA
jgi:hypothetical protein